MQTFLPYARFDASAAVLDDLRLGKQRVETLQILRALVFPSYKGWKNHPATAMWRGFVEALVSYGVAVCEEWERRGRADAVRRSLEEFTGGPAPSQDELALRGRLPPWLGTPAMHASHRASLVSKLPEHYRAHFPDVDPGRPYHWPVPLFPRWPVRRDLPLEPHEAVDERTAAVLAALRAPGPTVWLHDRPVEPPPPPLDTLRPPVGVRRPGRVTPSIARPPTPQDRASVAAEIATPPLLHVYRIADLADRRIRAAMPEPALVVAEGIADLRVVRRRFRRVEVLAVALEGG